MHSTVSPSGPRGRIAVLVTDTAAAQFLTERLEVSAEARGFKLQIESPEAALSPRFLHDTGSPLGLVVIPGARSSQAFRDALGPKGFASLRGYVQAGGSILGICQGFYLLSSEIRYTDVSGETKGSNDTLGLLPGLTVGDIRSHFNNGATPLPGRALTGWHRTTAVAVAFNRQSALNLPPDLADRPVSCFYWGGPFYLPTRDSRAAPLVSYLDSQLDGTLLAGASRRVGKGLVIGIGPHLEVSSSMLLEAEGLHLFDRDDGSYRRQLAAALAPDDERRTRLFEHLVSQALATPYGLTGHAFSAPFRRRFVLAPS